MLTTSRPRRAIDDADHRLLRTWTEDGSADLIAGLCLLLLGAQVAWDLPDLVFLAGPFLLAPAAWFALRRALVEPRIGRVLPDAAHAAWLDRKARVVTVVTMGLVVPLAYLATRSDGGDVLPSLVHGVLLVVPLGLAAVLFRLPRCLAYAAAALAAAGVTAWLGAPPSAPLLATGAVLTASGAALLARFVRRRPLPVAAGGDA